MTVDHGTRETVELYYQISARGIDKIEGESAFRVREKTEGINIKALRSVVTIGDSYVVNVKYVDLHHELQNLIALKTKSSRTNRIKRLLRCFGVGLRKHVRRRTLLTRL